MRTNSSTHMIAGALTMAGILKVSPAEPAWTFAIIVGVILALIAAHTSD